jgi:hypothetical protein
MTDWIEPPAIPVNGGKYLVTIQGAEGPRVDIAFYLSGVGWTIPSVVAWAQLPSPFVAPAHPRLGSSLGEWLAEENGVSRQP